MPPGLRLTTSTHFCLRLLPSTGSGNRSGHSHTPPTAPAGPNSLSRLQFLRFSDE